jgi:hypothetical protein
MQIIHCTKKLLKVCELFGRTDRVRECIDPFTMTFSKLKAQILP